MAPKENPFEMMGPPTEAVQKQTWALDDRGMRPQDARNVAELQSGLSESGYDPVVMQAGRSPFNAAANYIRGTSKTLRSPHIFGVAADIRDRQAMFDTASKRGRGYIEELHRLRPYYGMTAADESRPMWDPHHVEPTGKRGYEESGKLMQAWLASQGVSKQQLSAARKRVMALPKGEREAAARRELRSMIGTPATKEAVKGPDEAIKRQSLRSSNRQILRNVVNGIKHGYEGTIDGVSVGVGAGHQIAAPERPVR